MMARSVIRGFSGRVAGRWQAIPVGAKDAACAVLLGLFTQVELLLADRVAGPMVVQVVSFAVMTLAVAWRRTEPLLAAALAGGGLLAQTLAGEAPVVGGFIAVLVVMYSVASYADLRNALLGGALVLVGVFTYPLVNELTFADEAGNLAIFAGAWVLGRSIRLRQLRAVEADNRAAEVERDREQLLRAVIADERGRIARELHDIVAHGVSVMVLQAGAARQTIDRDPGKVQQLLLTVERMGRQSLNEMHRLLGVLRRSDDDLAFSPPSTLDSLSRLLDDINQTGLAVECRIEGDQRPLPAGLEVSAYRIVQEALTNVIKHARASHAEVIMWYRPEELELAIADDGRGGDADARPGGHGLVGMRERAELFGGSVTAGPGASNGWRVRAVLPIGGPS